jgi:hypothetical protein
MCEKSAPNFVALRRSNTSPGAVIREWSYTCTQQTESQLAVLEGII